MSYFVVVEEKRCSTKEESTTKVQEAEMIKK